MFYIFDKKGKNIGSCSEEPNNEDLATREEVAVEFNEEFQGDLVLVNNKIVVIDKRPSEYHELVNNEWVISDEKAQQQFKEAQRLLILKLRNKADELNDNILYEYPQVEIRTFKEQLAEALAYKKNKNADTERLSKIASDRGLPLDEIVDRVIRKSTAYKKIVDSIIAKRQVLMDKLEKATEQAKLDEIKQEIEQWQLSI
ncbi:hypothetical protein QJU89_05740 [Pasteurella skyensis]|uniref:Uncharacterized protein n=1 Tax=Phocoenobacter skyensis TaxID=97481 RepID=A0AAJ6N9D3_9PAST|nr:hypothetical protein [Pasteurella skyensis]MDP8162792.1 hypothetical protein [Pasteurella skyensis]MDP8172621.1 hypothetical protein [Pasteurella skyensis]MDP8179121.1 hypothetical protein [Pasteurella skyensis]MDP8183194.1 hypothetical protein [Pasteurella skyensis]MDP8189245.1 hypothetical protein [Pasteurella skyensis]